MGKHSLIESLENQLGDLLTAHENHPNEFSEASFWKYKSIQEELNRLRCEVFDVESIPDIEAHWHKFIKKKLDKTSNFAPSLYDIRTGSILKEGEIEAGKLAIRITQGKSEHLGNYFCLDLIKIGTNENIQEEIFKLSDRYRMELSSIEEFIIWKKKQKSENYNFYFKIILAAASVYLLIEFLKKNF